jgi:hypothetical protein
VYTRKFENKAGAEVLTVKDESKQRWCWRPNQYGVNMHVQS